MGAYLRVNLSGEVQSLQVGSVSTLVLLYTVTDQTQATCLGAIHHPGGEDELLSKRDTDHPGETLRATCTGEIKHLDGSWATPQSLMVTHTYNI